MTNHSGERQVDRMAIAEQVIVSAGEVLRAAGFDREEIASFFHQAADQLLGGAAPAETQTPASVPSGRTAQILSEFSAIPPVRELLRLQGEDDATQPPSTDASALDRQYELAMEAVPHLGAAQEWLRAMADEAGLPVRAGRDDAPADDLHGDALYLEDFEAVYGPSFALVGAVLGALVEQGREAAFRPLLLSLVNNNVTVTSTLKRSMDRWIAQIG